MLFRCVPLRHPDREQLLLGRTRNVERTHSSSPATVSLHIANASGAGFQYQAQPTSSCPRCRSAPFQHEHAETVIVVKEPARGDGQRHGRLRQRRRRFVRVPAGMHFAYRNAGDDPARVLCRTASRPGRPRRYSR